MRIFDSHCHLQDERILANSDAVMARARTAGVTALLCCGSIESDWDAVKVLSEKYPEIIPAFGLHPWYVKNRSKGWLDTLEDLLTAVPRAALGEIGLDHALDVRNDVDQESVFLDQMRLARKLQRPVSLHCRKAWEAMGNVLKTQGLPHHGGVIHSWSGPPDLVPVFEKAGASISFSCSVIYERNKRSHASATVVSNNRLLVETDSPDIPPPGAMEGENEPGNLIRVVEKLAELRGVSAEEIGELTYKNAWEIFGRK